MGDDRALYVRQAERLIGLRVGAVITDNRFTVERSGLLEFSPLVFPWGYPLLLAPFVAILGTDLDRLVVARAALFCWVLGTWWLLADAGSDRCRRSSAWWCWRCRPSSSDGPS